MTHNPQQEVVCIYCYYTPEQRINCKKVEVNRFICGVKSWNYVASRKAFDGWVTRQAVKKPKIANMKKITKDVFGCLGVLVLGGLLALVMWFLYAAGWLRTTSGMSPTIDQIIFWFLSIYNSPWQKSSPDSLRLLCWLIVQMHLLLSELFPTMDYWYCVFGAFWRDWGTMKKNLLR